MSQLTNATVKYAALPAKDFGNGPRINAVVTIDGTDQEHKLWGGPESEVAKLKRGQKIQLFCVGDKFHLVGKAAQPGPADPFHNKDKAAVAIHVTAHARLYAFCFSEAQRQFQNQGIEASEETIRCAASGIYISTQRKFDL